MATTDMKWGFPELNNPTVIDLSKTGNQEWWSFRPDEDVIFIGADTVRTQKLQTEGGHNIVVLGGDYRPVSQNAATIYFTKVTGTVHVEGVHIDNKNAWGNDGIAIYGPSGVRPNITIQNSLIENVTGTQNGAHGDVFQTHGAVGDIKIYNLTGSTNYQGIFIAPQYAPGHGSADLENVNIKWTDNSNTSYQYWFLDSAAETPYPITLKNVFTTERDGQTAEQASVWPKAGLGGGLGSVRVGNEISWPGLPYKGSITVGTPSSDFTQASEIGIGFQPANPIGGISVPPPSTGINLPGLSDVSATSTAWLNSTVETETLTGTAGNDQLAGMPGKNDVNLAGGLGDDTYIVDQPGDTITEAADAGTDTVLSYAANYTLYANVEHLKLVGTGDQNGTGNELCNRITGNDGANVLDGKGGNDMLTGGAGNDTFVVTRSEGSDAIMDFASGDLVKLQGFAFTSFAQLKSGMVENGTNVVLSLGAGQTLTFANKKIADFAAADFTFSGTVPTDPVPTDPMPGTGPAAISGGPTKWFSATSATTVLNGSSGNDQLAGLGGQADTGGLVGGAGDDTYIVDNAADKVVEAANAGNDTVLSYAASYTLSANVEHLTLAGSANINGTGNALANRMTGNTGTNILDGGAGNDLLTGGAGNDTFVVTKGEGNDTIADFTTGDVVNLQNSGFTSFTQVKAAMTQSGTNVVLNLGAGQTLTLADQTIANLTAADFGFSGTVPTDPGPTDPVPGTGPAAASASPTKWFSATSATTVLNGSSGSDQLAGIAGKADTGGLAGGLGDDTYIVDNAADKVVEAANAGNDTVLSYAANYTLSANVEHLTLAGTANYNGTGNDLANRITGNAGANILDGGAGNDLLTGGAGNDTFVVASGKGNDTITDFAAGTGAGDVVKLEGFNLSSFDAVRAAMTENGANVVLNLGNGQSLTFANHKIADFAENDFTGYKVVAGTSGNDSLTGTDAADLIDGKGGRDVMTGGKGDDTYIVDHSADKVVEKAGEGTDHVKSSVSYSLAANVENLTLTGTGAITGVGNAADNVVVGNEAANSIYAGNGNDVITGGGGADTLSGGDGADKFVYTKLADKGDVILDFDPTEDSLDLRPLMGSLGITSANPMADGLLNLLQSGEDVQVQVVSGGAAHTMVTIENVDVAELNPATDHWYS